jgi:hypothetical protein
MNKKQAADFAARMERVFNEEVGFRSALINRSYGGDLGTPTEKEREAATEEFPARTEKKGARGHQEAQDILLHQEAQDILRGYRGF